MDVVLAHPKGYDLLPETLNIAKKFAKEAGGSLKKPKTRKKLLAVLISFTQRAGPQCM